MDPPDMYSTPVKRRDYLQAESILQCPDSIDVGGRRQKRQDFSSVLPNRQRSF